MTTQTISMTVARTCGEACWLARQEVCRCSCNGANHGCKLVNGRPLPGRTKRVKDTRYRLVAVLPWAQRSDYRQLERLPHWAFQVVPKQCQWPEVKTAGKDAQFAWIEDTFTLEQAESQMAEAKAADDRKHQIYHLKECDGTTMHYRYPKIASPCGEPTTHGDA